MEAVNVKKIYKTRLGGNQVEALKDISFSVEEGESARILLSDASLLHSDSESADTKEDSIAPTVYIKVQSLSDGRIANIQRIATLNRGNAKVVLYDESTKKYSAVRSVSLDLSDKVISRLYSIFSEKDVIIK